MENLKKVSVIAGLSGAMIALAASSVQAEELITHDLGTTAIVAGDYQNAINELEQSTARNDPGALINLGHAYENVGRYAEAERSYRRALHSRISYDVKLVNGDRVGSRDAARMALAKLERVRNATSGQR